MTKLIPLDIVEKVGGLMLASDYRAKVDAGFQYELADMISKLMAAERDRVSKYVRRQSDIHNQLSEEVCDEDGEKWHIEMRDQLRRIADNISGGLK